MAKIGRKPIEIDLAQVESLAASQLDEKEIFTILGISERTFYKRKESNVQFMQAIAAGRAKFKAQIGQQIRAKIALGESDMIRFAAERKCGWTKPEKVDQHERKLLHEQRIITGDEIGPVLREILQGLGIDTPEDA